MHRIAIAPLFNVAIGFATMNDNCSIGAGSDLFLFIEFLSEKTHYVTATYNINLHIVLLLGLDFGQYNPDIIKCHHGRLHIGFWLFLK